MTSDVSVRPGEFTVGSSRRRVVCREISRTQIVQYAGAAGDYSPLHTDEPHAVRAGYRGVMAHGMMVMAATERLLADWLGRDRLAHYGVRFVSPVWPGDSLEAVATVRAVRDDADGRYVELEVVTTNQDGVAVLAGSASARI
ncbi:MULTISPECIES: MaoC family dehydratase [Nocardia]|uniref:MaoC family dehydratase n=1 Tax=Nocardia jiangxiensis TaxID=282685 RepID=A0ABW6S1J8_9NOCA|nr:MULTISPECIES: MaoC/PaaZ C-terminal domain-containing protein [Nocardia]